MLVALGVIVLLVAVNGLFVAAEFAAVTSRTSRLAEAGSRSGRWLAQLFAKPTGRDRFVAIAQLGITLASIGLGMYGEPTVARWLEQRWPDVGPVSSHALAFAVALGGITFLHVVFGEMIPKALALQTPERVSLLVTPLMRVFGFVFRPIVALLNSLAFGLMRLLRIPDVNRDELLHTAHELMFVTEETAQSGQIDSQQRNLIHNILSLDVRCTHEVMTPRAQFTSLAADMAPSDVSGVFSATELTRLPVFDPAVDDFVGFVHRKEFIRASLASSLWQQAIRTAKVVLNTAPLDGVLAELKAERVHAALVVDEFGTVVGLVTLDDIIAEVLDSEPAVFSYTDHGDGSWSFAGSITLQELRDDFSLPLSHPHAATLAGVVIAEAGLVPPAGTQVVYQGFTLTVESVDGRRVGSVRVAAM